MSDTLSPILFSYLARFLVAKARKWSSTSCVLVHVVSCAVGLPTQINKHQTPYIYSESTASAIFRWEAPARANGVIRGYEVQCWALPRNASSPAAAAAPAKASACADARLSPTHTQLVLRDLVPASIYYFKVSFIL